MFPFVPESCCHPGWPSHDCQGINSEYDGVPVKGPDPSVHGNPALYTNVSLSWYMKMFSY